MLQTSGSTGSPTVCTHQGEEFGAETSSAVGTKQLLGGKTSLEGCATTVRNIIIIGRSNKQIHCLEVAALRHCSVPF